MADFIEFPDWIAPAAPGPTPPRTAAAPEPEPEPATGPAAATGPAPEWRITYDGDSIAVTGLGLVGRNPAAQGGEDVEHVIAVGEAERSVSKTHLAFGVDASGFWVVDRNSTNGSAVIASDGTVTRCEPGVRVAAASGDRIRIGDLELRLVLE